MSGQPWYRHHAREFIDGVQGLGADTIGAYIVLLDLIYARGGPVLEDARHLAGILGCSTRLASTLIQRLVDKGKMRRVDGRLTNAKAEKELENSAETSRNQAEAGAKGGRNSANARRVARENADFEKDNKDLGQADLNLTSAKDNNREDKSREDVVVDAGAPARAVVPIFVEPPADLPDVLRLADELCRAGGVRHVDPGHIARHVGQIREWLASGADPPLMIETVRQAVSDATEPIHSLKYFDALIRQAVARKEGNLNGHQPRLPNRHRGDGFAQALEREVASLGGHG